MNKLLAFGFYLLTALLLPSCVTTESEIDGQAMYDQVSVTNRIYYYISTDSPNWLISGLEQSIILWNQALGKKILYRTMNKNEADVKINYTPVLQIPESPAYSHLLGCYRYLSFVDDCTIEVSLPKVLNDGIGQNLEELLLPAGDLDHLIKNTSSKATNFMRDKLVLLILSHEIGHTLGLGHNKNDDCLMASAPGGGSLICQSEVLAVRTKMNQ